MTPYVLIVEDETSIATLLEYNLEREGFETALAEDGDMAIVMAEERVPDLILLDGCCPNFQASRSHGVLDAKTQQKTCLSLCYRREAKKMIA